MRLRARERDRDRDRVMERARGREMERARERDRCHSRAPSCPSLSAQHEHMPCIAICPPLTQGAIVPHHRAAVVLHVDPYHGAGVGRRQSCGVGACVSVACVLTAKVAALMPHLFSASAATATMSSPGAKLQHDLTAAPHAEHCNFPCSRGDCTQHIQKLHILLVAISAVPSRGQLEP